jgi:glycosyltransferase involved in cell wall biosynthesis
MIIIPARNEAPRVAAIIAASARAAPGVPILVVVNGCEDETAEVAARAGATVIHSDPGYGSALLAGYRYALSQADLPWVVQLDADGQHPACEIPRLLAGLSGADVVIGSRFAEGGHAAGWPRRRRWTIALMGLCTSALTGARLRDVSSGFQALSPAAVQFLASDFPRELTDANVLARLHRAGFVLEEVGVKMAERQGGESMHGGIRSAIYAGKTVLAIMMEMRG